MGKTMAGYRGWEWKRVEGGEEGRGKGREGYGLEEGEICSMKLRGIDAAAC